MSPPSKTEKETAVRIDTRLARELKIAAAQDGTTIKALLERAARNALQERALRVRNHNKGPRASKTPHRG